jgi:ATP-dependent RNA helicase RhlE
MGFAPQIEQVLQTIPKTRQTMLFSATMPPEIVRVATRHMQLPLQVEIAPSGTTIDKITQELFIVSKISKLNLLSRLLHQYQGSVLLFSRTKIGAKKITSALRMEGHKAAEIHSDRSLSQRREALDGFKSGRYRILVATDIASRGIDVKNIEVVINFDLPDDVDNFVHRIGRTGRAGRPGHAITFATPEQGKEVREIESLIRSQIPIAKHPELPMETFISARPSSGPSRSGGGRRHGGWLKRRR